jgi:Chaperone of endosialidase
MNLKRGFLLLSLFGVLGMAVARAQEPGPEPIPNWPAPATWSPHSASRGVSTMAAVTNSIPFIGLAPCRIVDTRGNDAPIQGGMFTGGSDVRNYAVAGICGIPGTAQALSLNFTVTGPGQTAAGFLLAWPTGGAVPPVSILNWDHIPAQIANAAVVPTNASVSFTVNVSAPTHVIIDVNGYYAPAGVGANNTFLGRNAGNFTMTGDQNTGFGHNVLSSDTMGGNNSGFGNNALASNDMGTHNTATGSGALSSNTGGIHNTATGSGALLNNVLGSENTASGAGALGNTTGDSNIGIGSFAGIFLTTGSNNICIGNAGVAAESDVIRIGEDQTKTFVAGVHGVTTGGVAVPVMIDASGQLGTVSSSVRFKEEVRDMGEATERLLKLRPVTFRYKAQPEGRTEFGLIAEEVEKVMPELVVCSPSGEAETVLYHEIPSMLLNELQKQQRDIQELKSELAALRATIDKK